MDVEIARILKDVEILQPKQVDELLRALEKFRPGLVRKRAFDESLSMTLGPATKPCPACGRG